MELTVQHLREWFRTFNAAYFGGQLPEPRLTVSRARTQLGQFSCRRQRQGLFQRAVLTGWHIKVSDYYDMPERAYQETLLHEMIHYYIAYTGARDASAHGPLFRREMERLNAEGWHISVSERSGRWPARRVKAGRRYLLVLLQTADGRYFVSVVNPGYRTYIDLQAAASPQIVAHAWRTSTDDGYASWPRTRSLRGRRITAEAYRQLLEGNSSNVKK
ncbi:MAG: SprT-like domain-containing protein [Prevotella sp.]|nr:SprT-like domain-containing protein [Prevotella sp.]